MSCISCVGLMMAYKFETCRFVKHLKNLVVSTISYVIEVPNIRGQFCAHCPSIVINQVTPLLLRCEKLQGTYMKNKVVTEIRLVTCQLMFSASRHHAAQFFNMSLTCYIKSVRVQCPHSVQKHD